QDAGREAQQAHLFDVLRQRRGEREAAEAARERDDAALERPPTFYVGERRVDQPRPDPSARYVTFVLVEAPNDPARTREPGYVTESGYAEEVQARPKVGAPGEAWGLYVQALTRDTTYRVELAQLPGAYDVPAYRREAGAAVDSSRARGFYVFGPYWSGDGRYAVVDVRAADHKDRWIALLDPEAATLRVLDRQHDDAWVAGPGIGWSSQRSDVGWHPGNRWFYFQSEKTGYSH